jgi:outer membrane protein OmpA-like peptidoglycan-associated protein
MSITAGLVLSLLGTGCVATHKYVAKTIAPVEQRVSSTEAKNGEQDQKLAANASQIESVDSDLSRTKEKLNDTDAKVVAAASAAAAADAKAAGADAKAVAANNFATSADERAQKGIQTTAKSVDTLREDVRAGKYKMVKSDTVLFGLNVKTLNDEAKAQLDSFAGSLSGLSHYVVEVQGFTDKTGPSVYNDELSQERAAAVARYLANQHKVPLRSINMLGSGVAEGAQKTREERKMGRKVDVRVYVPEI